MNGENNDQGVGKVPVLALPQESNAIPVISFYASDKKLMWLTDSH